MIGRRASGRSISTILRDPEARLFLVAANYVVTAQAVVSGPLVAHLLLPDLRGQLAVVMTAMTLTTSLTALGLVSTLNGSASRFGALEMWTATRTWRRGAMVAGLVLAPLVGLIAQLVGVTFSAVLAVAVCIAILNPAATVNVGVLTARGSYRGVFVARAGSAGVLVVGLIALALWGVRSVSAIFAVYMLAAALPAVLGRRREPGSPDVRDVAALKRILRRDAPGTAAYSLLTMANARLDQLILPLALSNSQIGLYAIAGNYGGLVNPLALTIASISMRRFAIQPHVRRRFLPRLAIPIATSCVLAALSPVIVPIMFGHRYAAAVPATMMMCGAAVAQASAILLTSELVALGQSRRTIPGGLAALACVPLCIPLANAWGIQGAAAASAVCYVVDAAWQYHQRRRYWARARETAEA